ncbi:hypothetical protein BFN03_02130 [Rhodococcus sp. WMMA185]|uniref:hypothetical protein n=1 Tax=Rhodococcus sp. WMMA185 TaxID=679318 RepID=UPI0008783CE2|nr:hypothetical protein [Rhodococcus sp. WMMA185]AOW91897.1 hypothetical protein BFN03_02130 [Rhodococcus sp. WMMA185]
MNKEPHRSHLLPVRRAFAAAGLVACAGIAVAAVVDTAESAPVASLVSAGSGTPDALSSGF